MAVPELEEGVYEECHDCKGRGLWFEGMVLHVCEGPCGGTGLVPHAENCYGRHPGT